MANPTSSRTSFLWNHRPPAPPSAPSATNQPRTSVVADARISTTAPLTANRVTGQRTRFSARPSSNHKMHAQVPSTDELYTCRLTTLALTSSGSNTATMERRLICRSASPIRRRRISRPSHSITATYHTGSNCLTSNPYSQRCLSGNASIGHAFRGPIIALAYDPESGLEKPALDVDTTILGALKEYAKLREEYDGPIFVEQPQIRYSEEEWKVFMAGKLGV